jgi:hypothetical protein
MQEPLRESKCENHADVPNYWTKSLTDAQFYLFDALGKNIQEDLARWRDLVSEQVTSGTSVAGFCRDCGLRD